MKQLLTDIFLYATRLRWHSREVCLSHEGPDLSIEEIDLTIEEFNLSIEKLDLTIEKLDLTIEEPYLARQWSYPVP